MSCGGVNHVPRMLPHYEKFCYQALLRHTNAGLLDRHRASLALPQSITVKNFPALATTSNIHSIYLISWVSSAHQPYYINFISFKIIFPRENQSKASYLITKIPQWTYFHSNASQTQPYSSQQCQHQVSGRRRPSDRKKLFLRREKEAHAGRLGSSISTIEIEMESDRELPGLRV